MIITAKVAQEQANSSPKQPKKIRNYLIRQLRRVEKAINRASKKRKTSLHYHCLNGVVYEVLERNGYTIELKGNWDYDWIIIHWSKPT